VSRGADGAGSRCRRADGSLSRQRGRRWPRRPAVPGPARVRASARAAELIRRQADQPELRHHAVPVGRTTARSLIGPQVRRRLGSRRHTGARWAADATVPSAVVALVLFHQRRAPHIGTGTGRIDPWRSKIHSSYPQWTKLGSAEAIIQINGPEKHRSAPSGACRSKTAEHHREHRPPMRPPRVVGYQRLHGGAPSRTPALWEVPAPSRAPEASRPGGGRQTVERI
jgi:hypothetical protein